MTYELICIGASWGGLHAVGQVLRDIPPEVDQPIVIAQHRYADAFGALPQLLGHQANRRVVDVDDKTAIERNHVYIAPPDYHLLVERGSFALSIDERVKYARPSIDVLFESAADAYGPAVVGVILTGANEDGAAGLARIKERGGVAVIQDPEGAERRTMPDAAIAATAADAVLPLQEIGKFDYLLKPFDPNVLRTKVAVFVDLHRKNLELRRQAELSRESELTSARRESEQRYRALADAMPQIVWTAGPDGKATYYNRRWYEYTGLSPGPPTGDEWISVVHPDDLQRTLDIRRETLSTGEIFEVEYRFRSADGSYRWHLGRAVPLRHDDTGPIDFWVGTATDIDAHKRTQQSQEFLLRTGAVLAESLDYRRPLQSVAPLAVPEIADWCAVDLLEADGSIHPLALTHADPGKVTFATELTERYPPDPAADTGAPRVIRNGKAEVVADITADMLE